MFPLPITIPPPFPNGLFPFLNEHISCLTLTSSDSVQFSITFQSMIIPHDLTFTDSPLPLSRSTATGKKGNHKAHWHRTLLSQATQNSNAFRVRSDHIRFPASVACSNPDPFFRFGPNFLGSSNHPPDSGQKRVKEVRGKPQRIGL